MLHIQSFIILTAANYMTLRRIISQGLINDHFGSFLPSLRSFSSKSVEQSNLPYQVDVEEFDFNKVKIDDEKLIQLVNSRYEEKPFASITTAFNEPNFLDFSFLEKGMICGRAVCRLLRKIDSNDDVQNLLDLLDQANSRRREDGREPFTKKDLIEIFSIPEEHQIEFFRNYENTPYLAFSQFDIVQNILPLIPAGTGFLVGSSHLLTAHHILGNDEPTKLVAEFNYEKVINGFEVNSVQYDVKEEVIISNPDLDYILLKLESEDRKKEKKEAGIEFNYISITKRDDIIAPPLTWTEAKQLDPSFSRFNKPVVERLVRSQLLKTYKPNIEGIDGEPVIIIQHPKGQHKQIVVSSNRTIALSDDCLYYEADAENGSSGSPIFNQEWELVGLHRAYISEDEPTLSKNDEDITLPQGDIVVGFEGIRICNIAKDIGSKRNNSPDIQDFVDRFLDKGSPWEREKT